MSRQKVRKKPNYELKEFELSGADWNNSGMIILHPFYACHKNVQKLIKLFNAIDTNILNYDLHVKIIRYFFCVIYIFKIMKSFENILCACTIPIIVSSW